jgi:DNA polymerase-3 subunit delta'
MRPSAAIMPFRDVFGHRRLVSLLARAVPREALPPSLILSGPEGVGKRLVATAAAQALNCTNRQHFPIAGPEAVDACGTCAACVRIARGVHPDVFVVAPGETGSIKVDAIREVVERAAYRPFEGRRRVLLIDDAEAMMPPAQNALLKTLEEPPSGSIFMLVTSRPDALLPTVQSRCPRLRFWPLSAEEVAAVLIRGGVDPSGARAVAAASGGSVSQALEASAGDLEVLREVAAGALAHAATSLDPRRRLEAAKDLVTKSGSGLASERAQLAAELTVMAALLRDVEARMAQGERAALANPEAGSMLRSLDAFRGERGVHAFAAIDEALLALEGNASAKTVADWLMLRL